jgi:hypothetical protein
MPSGDRSKAVMVMVMEGLLHLYDKSLCADPTGERGDFRFSAGWTGLEPLEAGMAKPCVSSNATGSSPVACIRWFRHSWTTSSPSSDKRSAEAVCGIWTWVEKHMKAVERSRQAYDRLRPSATEARANTVADVHPTLSARA